MILFDNRLKIKWKRDNPIESKMKKKKTRSSIPIKSNFEGQNWKKSIQKRANKPKSWPGQI